MDKRHVISALKKMLENREICERQKGMCKANFSLWFHGVISSAEYDSLDDFLSYKIGMKYYAPPYQWKPRFAWIKQQIKTLENEINHIPIS